MHFVLNSFQVSCKCNVAKFLYFLPSFLKEYIRKLNLKFDVRRICFTKVPITEQMSKIKHLQYGQCLVFFFLLFNGKYMYVCEFIDHFKTMHNSKLPMCQLLCLYSLSKNSFRNHIFITFYHFIIFLLCQIGVIVMSSIIQHIIQVGHKILLLNQDDKEGTYFYSFSNDILSHLLSFLQKSIQ